MAKRLTAFRVVRPDFQSSRGFTWPFPGGEAVAPGPILDHKQSCPQAVGDGLCLAKTWAGAATGGMPAATVLICTYLPGDVLGEDDNKVRVGRAKVERVVDFYATLRTGVRDADLPANLRGSNLRGSDLRGSDLRGSDLSGSNLSWSNLSGSDLRGSDLSWSNLRGSNLRGSDLRGSNLSWSDLRGSDLRGSDLRGSNLSWSDLSGSNLSWSDLGGSDLRGSTGDKHTILPPGYRVTDSGLIVRDGAA